MSETCDRLWLTIWCSFQSSFEFFWLGTPLVMEIRLVIHYFNNLSLKDVNSYAYTILTLFIYSLNFILFTDQLV